MNTYRAKMFQTWSISKRCLLLVSPKSKSQKLENKNRLKKNPKHIRWRKKVTKSFISFSYLSTGCTLRTQTFWLCLSVYLFSMQQLMKGQTRSLSLWLGWNTVIYSVTQSKLNPLSREEWNCPILSTPVITFDSLIPPTLLYSMSHHLCLNKTSLVQRAHSLYNLNSWERFEGCEGDTLKTCRLWSQHCCI